MSKKHSFLLGVSSLLICMVPSQVFAGSDTLAKVGWKKIKLEQLNTRLKQFPESSQAFLEKKENKVKVLDQLIVEEVLYQEARKAKFHKEPSYKAEIKKMKRQLLISKLIQQEVDQKAMVSDEEVRAFYDLNKSDYEPKSVRNLSHILLKTRADALKVQKLLIAQEYKNFKEIASQYSIDPSKGNGGNLGWISKGQVVPEFERAAFTLPYKGSVSKIVKTDFGFHIIKLEGKKRTERISFEQAKPQINQNILGSKRQELYESFIAKAKEDTKIKRTISNL